VGAIDNATYRQLDTTITHGRARVEIHKLCELGFIEKHGQGCNTYHIRTDKVVSLGERLLLQDERLLPQHGTLAKRYQGESRESLLSQMSDDIQDRINHVGKRVPKETLNQLVIDMCTARPLGMDEFSPLLHRNAKSFKNKNIKILLESKKLFY